MKQKQSYNCNGITLDLSSPQVMGIVNLTHDSFYKKSRHTSIDSAIVQVGNMLKEGASIIDLGAVSSRPGADMLTYEEESKRLFPVLKELRKTFPLAVFSIDTFRSMIAEESINIGANMINDISAGELDVNMFEVMSRYKTPYIMMHMKGKPANMQDDTNYSNIVLDVMTYLNKKIARLKHMGKNDIIIDPGFGFGKSIEGNYKILQKLDVFNSFELPVLVGLSRKSMIYKLLDITPEESLSATSALNLQALQNGAKILRVHDVKEAIQTVKMSSLLDTYQLIK